MRPFVRGAPPDGLLAAAYALKADLDAIEARDGAGAASLRERARPAFGEQRGPVARALHAAQGGLCAFCERRVLDPADVPVGRDPPTVEHWVPVSVAPRLALDWKNLVLSCPDPATCNQARRAAPLPSPPPDQHAYEADLELSPVSGHLRVRQAPAHLDPVQAQIWRAVLPDPGATPHPAGHLGLNHPALVEARRGAMRGVLARFERDHAGAAGTRAQRLALAAAHRAARPVPLLSAQLAWLER